MSAFTSPQRTSLCLKTRQEQASRCRSTHFRCHAVQDPLLLRVARGEGRITCALFAALSFTRGDCRYLLPISEAATCRDVILMQRRRGHRCG